MAVSLALVLLLLPLLDENPLALPPVFLFPSSRWGREGGRRQKAFRSGMAPSAAAAGAHVLSLCRHRYCREEEGFVKPKKPSQTPMYLDAKWCVCLQECTSLGMGLQSFIWIIFC